ncbi:hypothetical protein A9W95_21605 [Mycobacterium sp. 1423905.2]|nr:hypothetical protein A9W95_21605 [Mycobacterium sp. 1423905.2]
MTARVTFDFTDTAVLVTGGTSGFGHATATLFRDAGATVTITGTKADPSEYSTDLTGMRYRRLIRPPRRTDQQRRSQLPRGTDNLGAATKYAETQ